MDSGITKRRVFERECDILDFARSYLSEAFPNPERQSCPPDDALRALANRPTQSDETVSNHLTCCSPCFNGYMGHLAHTREGIQSQKIRRALFIRLSLVASSLAVISMIGTYMFFIRRHKEFSVAPRMPALIDKPATPTQAPATATYVPVMVDLSNASPVRGVHVDKAGSLPQVIPSDSLIDLSLLLPLGSEDRRYSVRLSSNRYVAWSGSTQAHLENGQMLLHIHADFTHVRTGNYDLVVVSKLFRLTVPVLVKSTSPGSLQ